MGHPEATQVMVDMDALFITEISLISYIKGSSLRVIFTLLTTEWRLWEL
jgi:hypothetical protein